MVSNPKAFLTEEEYLAFERKSQNKHEYYDGEIFAMTGARRAHQQITSNLVMLLGSQLRSSDCSVYPTDLRVKIQPARQYVYPDIVVTCGEQQFLDNEFDTLLNPVVLIEVLSESTEAKDRGVKLQHYKDIESLQEYLLVSQRMVRIEHYVRQVDGSWRYTDMIGAGSNIELPSIGCGLKLAEVYEKVVFVGD